MTSSEAPSKASPPRARTKATYRKTASKKKANRSHISHTIKVSRRRKIYSIKKMILTLMMICLVRWVMNWRMIARLISRWERVIRRFHRQVTQRRVSRITVKSKRIRPLKSISLQKN